LEKKLKIEKRGERGSIYRSFGIAWKALVAWRLEEPRWIDPSFLGN